MISAPVTYRRLAEVRLGDAAEVGGKAAGIGQLIAEGIRVPDGVVLVAGIGDLSTGQRRDLVRAATADLGPGPFAVRSSGVSEDGIHHSFAGMYETFLDVEVGELPAAVDRCLASAHAGRVADYSATDAGRLAVIVQRMVAATAAGVALTADPVNGDRETTGVSAVRGTGDRLVSGAALADEWVVADGRTTARRQPEHAIDRRQASSIAAEARRIAAARGIPQDIEWAIDADGALWILQARPMTALPPEVSWASPARGAYTRQLRLGEWISEPVTQLFESWLLTRMEERMHGFYLQELGQRAPRPLHVIVNGWYFYSLNWFSPGNLARSFPSMLAHLVRNPRKFAGVAPPTVHFAVPTLERLWREDVQPRHRAAVAAAESRVETLPVDELPELIDAMSDVAGEAFAWITALSGAAYKMEINLAAFYRKHLAASVGGSHLPLLAGLVAPSGPDRHAVVSIDWWYPPAALAESAEVGEEHARVVEARRDAEAAAVAALSGSPRRLRAFQRLLSGSQHLVPIRDEQTRELTLAWPAVRRAVVRLGERLTSLGAIRAPEDVFFLTRAEAIGALRGEPLSSAVNVAERRTLRESQSRLVPPMFVGQVNRMLRSMPGSFARMLGARPSERALVSGSPASAGRASGSVRVVHGPAEFDDLLPGEILVAPLTAPAWTPLFVRAAAVVTDVGSAASHASIIAREYGIPAVVGCGDATARLHTGMLVTVDGNTGNVEPA